jgi:hypothetical protein
MGANANPISARGAAPSAGFGLPGSVPAVAGAANP